MGREVGESGENSPVHYADQLNSRLSFFTPKLHLMVSVMAPSVQLHLIRIHGLITRIWFKQLNGTSLIQTLSLLVFPHFKALFHKSQWALILSYSVQGPKIKKILTMTLC